jgi:sugar/nucleoside kinase (ribokinase family)
VLVPAPPFAIALASRCDAVVLSEHEHDACTELLDAARSAGAVIAITAGDRAQTIITPSAPALTLPVQALEDPVEDLGAGDVYAGVFFIALHEGRTPADAGALAAAAARLRMTGTGAASIAHRDAIEAAISGGGPRR